MAFATGHTARNGFVAGQLRDGDSFGTIDVASYNGQAVKFKIDLRYYKNTLIPVVSVLKASDNTVIEQPAIKQAQYLTNLLGLALPNNIPALKDLAALAPTLSKIQSLGLIDNGLVPVNASNELMPFEQTADGSVKAYVSAADAQKKADDAAATQQTLLTKLTTAVTGDAATTSTSGATTTTGMSKTTKIIIAVVAAVVVGGIIYLATRKKKSGGRK
ncbi:hypothetical protein GO755_33480 [Spirosoma sp. HMF4905]|uniref:Uncharacterized protein n=1 Tax=Spirosoma arboris TaxID=2682092 RepID=A0A7K1SMI1_9BACT|nr:hypothetical protein [Spirosoma arboris]MVM34988.1 hypothetical protein [Spirosoma arboris]